MSVDSVIQHHSSNGNHSLILPTKKKNLFLYLRQSLYSSPWLLAWVMDTWNLLSPKICAKIIIIKKMEFIFCRVFS